MAEPIVTKKINSISFGVVSPSLIKKLSVVNVITPEIYDADGYPVTRGLMDPAMGVIDPGLRCKTCGGRLKTCQGHFGHIILSKSIVHVLYAKQVHDFLKTSCRSCGRIVMKPDQMEKFKANIGEAKREHNLDRLRNLITASFSRMKNVKECPYCSAKKLPIKHEKPTSFIEGDTRLWPDQIKEWLEKIPDEDIKVLGFDPTVVRPEWMILNNLLVPPIIIRPSITLETGERSEDDLTHKMSDIVRVNQRLLENINAGAPEIIVEDLWDLLQYHITTYFNNKIAQIPPARHRSKRPLKTLAQRLMGKEGRFRYNLAGKRVNFCARSVISPDPMIDINELGVPLQMAKELTIPEKVTEWNMAWLKKLLDNFDKYPGANYVFTDDGKRKKITEDTKETIIQELQPGWIVERQLTDGDIVIFNRQPSLHRLSMMGHIVKVVPGSTLRINPLVIVPYNADFDGDEMNLHLPQTEEARSEATNLLILKNQIITPRYGLSIIGATKEILLGLYYLTNDMELTRSEASDLMVGAGIEADLPKPIKKLHGKEIWDGKQIFSMLLPDNLNFTERGIFSKNGKIVKGDVIIKKGQLIQGIMNHKMVGNEGGHLIHKLYREFDSDVTSDFLNRVNHLSLAVGQKIAYTHSFYDLDIPKAQESQIKKILDDADKESDKIIENYKKGKIRALPGKTVTETFEAQMLSALSNARSRTEEVIEKVVKEDSTLVNSARAGAGDKLLNISLMSGFAGQQALRGERINFGYKGRPLPHFNRGDLKPEAHGFVKNGYVKGLNPIELFFNAIVGRDSLMDTAMRTPKSGYMQRRLINALQDIKVEYDGTVRDSGRKIIQFNFGGDGIDVSKSDGGTINETKES